MSAKGPKLLLIEWLDSCSNGKWDSIENLERNNAEPLYCRSIGWLVARNRKVITIVSSLSGEKNKDVRVNGTGDICIPMRCVTRVKELRL